MAVEVERPLVISPSNERPSSSCVQGYNLLRVLGQGAYAKVYLAELYPKSAFPDRFLACKIIDTTKIPPEFSRKFLPREIEILSLISHPHIIHVHAIFHRDTKFYILLRHAENGDLQQFMARNGAVIEGQAKSWFRQIVLGLDYLHRLEIAHRDLKCDNVLITSNYNVKISDLGFARRTVDEKGRKVMSSTYCGSLSHIAPEVLRGRPYDPKLSDLWSLGVILYIMLNASKPFDDRHVKRLFEMQSNNRWRFREKVSRGLSPGVKQLVTNLLQPDIKKRWRMELIQGCDWLRPVMRMSSAERKARKQADGEVKKWGLLHGDAERKKGTFWNLFDKSWSRSSSKTSKGLVAITPYKESERSHVSTRLADVQGKYPRIKPTVEKLPGKTGHAPNKTSPLPSSPSDTLSERRSSSSASVAAGTTQKQADDKE
uniref:Protein kinase domain-containing protein n=1 Tax=Timema shepardi TaxID=629360 RepID=A0A7R9BAN5_TIMSH|nr:unnamed protein product [Timema shepardi]